MPRITDFCSCIYVLGCRLSLVRLCDSDFGITPVDDITIGITCAAFCFHMVLIIIIIIIIVVVVVELIALLSIYLLTNLHLSHTVGETNFSHGKEIRPIPQGQGVCRVPVILYVKFVIILLYAPLLTCFWSNLHFLYILESFWWPLLQLRWLRDM